MAATTTAYHLGGAHYAKFSSYVRRICGRCLADLSAFELAGFRLAHTLDVAEDDAFDFLGRFGTLDDIAAAANGEAA